MDVTPLDNGQFQISTTTAQTYDLAQLLAQQTDLQTRLDSVTSLIAAAQAAGVVVSSQ